MLAMPLILYPTQLVWVDDDELFLQIAVQQFKNLYNIQSYHHPSSFLKFFEKYHPVSTFLPLLKGCKEHEEYDFINHLPVDINLDSIIQLQTNTKRFSDISVMIVDHHLPEQTGLELCDTLKDFPIKKILLTGEADHNQAVEAFNDGIIDCFLRKDHPFLKNQLITHIEKFKKKYFVDITKSLLSHLETDYTLPHSDTVFIDFFEDWCKKNHIYQYYPVDKNGTFVTIDKTNIKRYFVIHTDRSLNIFSQLYAEDEDVKSFIQFVTKRNKIPFFGTAKEPWNYEPHEWINHFYSPNVLNGRDKYYWASIDSNLQQLS